MRVTVLSDTHGLLRPEALELARGSDLILHAGDVGDPDILLLLAEIAPVKAVRGNVDVDGDLACLPDVHEGDLGAFKYRMVHQREHVGKSWPREVQAIFFGHSHRPELEWQSGCMLLNPGSIGRRRFKWPLTLARITVREGRMIPEILAVE